MANFKAEIAEALFDSSVKVSREALLWTMSNLPDGENKGPHSIGGKLPIDKNFDHNQESILRAVGISEAQAKELSGVMAKELAKVKEPNGRVSIVVEGVLNAIEEHPDLIKLIVIKTVQDALDFAESASEMGDISKMIKMIKLIDKLKGKDNED